MDTIVIEDYEVVSSIFWQSPGFEAQITKLVTINSNSHLGAISQYEQRAMAICACSCNYLLLPR